MAYLGRKGASAALTSADIPDDSITSAKIPDNALDSEHYTDGSIDSAHIGDDQVTGAKIENNPTIAGNLTVSGDLVPATPLSHRNIVINGAMQVSQRGTSQASISGTSTGYKNAPDRFWFGSRATGTWTVSQSTEAPAGFGSSYKFDNTTADASLDANSYLQLATRFEGQDLQHLDYGTSGAKTTTLSFYVRSNLTGTFIVELEGTESTNRHIAKTYTISSANTWERKEVTFAGDTTVASDNNNGGAISIIWWLASGTDYTSGTLASSWQNMDSADRAVGISNNLGSSTSNDFHITGIQWEVGSNATPFEHRSYSEELERCKRYYQQSWDGDSPNQNSNYVSITPPGGLTGNVFIWDCPYQKEPRANPTVTLYSPSNGASGEWRCDANDTSYTVSAEGPWRRHCRCSVTSPHVGRSKFHYKIESEL